MYLPISKEDALQRGWDEVDVVLVSGDAYVDHPSFGVALIGRILEYNGFRVGIIAMPDCKNKNSFSIFGKPRLFFGITSGNVDSMISKYTAFKRKRSDDPYVPGGLAGHKPDRALINYCNIVKSIYKDVPIVIGGIEASMRRIAHYDYWSDKIRRSIIEDTRADILVYGMGEKAICEIGKRLDSGQSPEGIKGTVIMMKEPPDKAVLLPAEESVMKSKESFLECYKLFYRNQHRVLAQPTNKRYLVHFPAAQLTTKEIDEIYNLPYERSPHPQYLKSIPAFEMIRNSITAHRGCFSGCSFCSLTLHHGKRIVSRSQNSVLKEISEIITKPYFKGQISDVGGPSANMYGFMCKRYWKCSRESCTFPTLCSNLVFRTREWIDLLDKISSIKKVKKVSIGSGIRYDVFMRDPHKKILLKKLIKKYISGQLKIAPEHTHPKVLRAMRKTPLLELSDFIKYFKELDSKKEGKQHLVPYLMSSHPGCDLTCMNEMKTRIRSMFGYIPFQVQSFIPLPMTLSSVIYYTGVDPLTDEKFTVTRSMGGKRKQHQVFFNK